MVWVCGLVVLVIVSVSSFNLCVSVRAHGQVSQYECVVSCVSLSVLVLELVSE